MYPFTGYKTSKRFERAKVRVASSRLNRLDVAPKKFAPSANAVAPVAPMNTRRGDTGAMFDDDDDGNDGAARRSVSELSVLRNEEVPTTVPYLVIERGHSGAPVGSSSRRRTTRTSFASSSRARTMKSMGTVPLRALVMKQPSRVHASERRGCPVMSSSVGAMSTTETPARRSRWANRLA